jgi:two-component system, LytTR family, sensor kinase
MFMNKTDDIQKYLNKPLIKHSLFWLIIFCFHVITANWTFYSSLEEVIDNKIIMTSLQVIVAYITITILIPNFLNKKKNLSFILLLIALLVSVVTIYHIAKVYYIEPTYPESYVTYFKTYGYSSVIERVFNIPVTVSKAVFYSSPTILLLLFQFYRDQQRLAKLNEQKRTAELTALKHQLNPHFLFNTLNNLYSLALEKSDKTPEVIEKLSEILDYMLYGCNETFVLLQKEIELIDNYLALEKVRYGGRVSISFNKPVKTDIKIAPLVLLTFIENAFKHGVSQELNEAYILIEIEVVANKIIFKIENSIPKNLVDKNDKQSIGIDNVKKQLFLLYGDDYFLEIKNYNNIYNITLELESK